MKKMRHNAFSLLRVLVVGPRYRLTEDDKTQRCRKSETESEVERPSEEYLETRRQMRPKLGCAVCFVSALFEVV